LEFLRIGTTPALLAEYARLFAACFPQATHLDATYLQWLYAANPAGPVVGFDAWDGDRLAAHYACVPARMRWDAVPRRALLSLNTATHPDYQGQGLFTKLAEATYAAAAEAGFALVHGVANANSTPGFVKKLGFHLVGPLDSLVGVGRLRGVDLARAAEAPFRRDWSPAELRWRCANPARPVRVSALADGSTGYSAPTGKPGMSAWMQLPGPPPDDAAPAPWGARVFLGLFPAGAGRPRTYAPLPQRLRPSPLNLIVRDLRGDVRVQPADVSFGFLDFEAF
jgi:GNAT superfamily N-acetyltransferase